MEKNIQNINKSLNHGGIDYLDFLRAMDERLRPRSYLEIGTRWGESLACFRCAAVCVDPEFQLASSALTARGETHLFQMTSDEFFAGVDVRRLLPRGPDVAFLDGLHWFEYLLRDFINVEAAAHPGTIILLHDCLPLNARMALREFIAGPASEPTRLAWTGDVWKMLFVLKKFRPDLDVRALDCSPTGLILVTNLDPGSDVLATRYEQALSAFGGWTLDAETLDQLWELYPLLDSRAVLDQADGLHHLGLRRFPPACTPAAVADLRAAFAQRAHRRLAIAG
ncbi:MAG: class I SAM-dependent methyltransferase [Hyphomicrobiales bacterium]|nr:class I SAM-dependent methyltransferase [Hyphomicrobiales bacterium]